MIKTSMLRYAPLRHCLSYEVLRISPKLHNQLQASADCTMPRSTPPSDLSGLMMVFYAVVATLPLTVVFVLPGFLSVAGRVAGWVMCKRTEGRRAQLIALMNEDDKTFRARRENSPEHRSAEDRRSQMGAADAVKDRGDWDGIIGFFHPFWYVDVSRRLSCKGR